MTDFSRIYGRILRRETHASRTAPAVIVAFIMLLAAAVAVTGAILWMTDSRFRESASGWLTALHARTDDSATLIGAGVGAMALALALMALALLPGRRPRRSRTEGRLAILVDDGVLADAAADAVARGEELDRRQVAVRLAHGAARVIVTPTSGYPVDSARAAEAAETAIEGLGFRAKARVSLTQRGVVA